MGLLGQDSYLTFIDGPVESGGHRWWKVDCEWCTFLNGSNAKEGWIAENTEWLGRSY